MPRAIATCEFECEIPAGVLQQKMQPQIENLLEDLLTWASFDISWTQRYAVEAGSRMLYTFEHGEVISKQRALDWATRELPAEWNELIAQVRADRFVQWNDPRDPDPSNAPGRSSSSCRSAPAWVKVVRLPGPGNNSNMSDLQKAAEQARERAKRARERAADAHARARQQRQRISQSRRDAARSQDEASAARMSEDRARESARLAHKQAADLFEEHARDLAAAGDEEGARRAQAHADEAREREDHE
jgi:ribosomal protein L32